MADLTYAALFAGVSLPGVQALADRGRPKAFAAGSILIRQGDIGETMYVILNGRVRVQREHAALAEPVLLAELDAGQVVGEMGLLDGEPRSATVIAIDEVEAVELTATDLTEVMLEHPDVATTLLKTLSRRVRSTDELVERALQREAQG